MHACRNLSSAKTPINLINKTHTRQKLKKALNRNQCIFMIPKQKAPMYRKITKTPASQPIPLPCKQNSLPLRKLFTQIFVGPSQRIERTCQ